MAWGRGLLVIALAACGRERFDDASNMDGIAHDEDLDGIVDPADNCPALFNDRQDDRDGDDVGDFCDPHPDTPGDRLISAGFFTDSFGDWVPTAADAWSFGTGSLEPAAADPDAVAVTLSLTATAAVPTVELIFTAVDYGAAVDEHLLQITMSFTDRTAYCKISGGNSNPLSQVVLIVDGNGPASGLPNAVATNMPTQMQMTQESADVACRAASANLATPYPMGTGNVVITIDIRGARIGITNALVYDVQ